MNTAVRTMSTSTLRWIQLPSLMESIRRSAVVLMISMLLLGSAFAVVYAKDRYRCAYIERQNLLADQDSARVEWSRLILEQSTWSTQARVQEIATDQLKMIAPQTADIRVITEK